MLVERIAALAVIAHRVVAVHAQMASGLVELSAALAQPVERREAHPLEIVEASIVRVPSVGPARQVAMHDPPPRVGNADRERLFPHPHARAAFQADRAAVRRLLQRIRHRLPRQNHGLHGPRLRLAVKGVPDPDDVPGHALDGAYIRARFDLHTPLICLNPHLSPLLFVMMTVL